ncbi:hypothetical protein ID866_508 [Astraeus odoratus]|nr:hypothetical protein ID866_508 [Astraeus odoratus]
MSETPTVDAQPLRRTQSTGNIPSGARESVQSARARGSTSNNRPGPIVPRTSAPSPPNNQNVANTGSWLRQPEQTSPRDPDAQRSETPEPSQSLYARAKRFFGIGPNVSKTRKALVSLVLTLSYSLMQVCCSYRNSPEHCICYSEPAKSFYQSDQCLWTPFGSLECHLDSETDIGFWVVILALYTDTNSVESAEPALPYNHLYARLSLLASMLSLAWFLTAHVLEYTSIQTCRLSAPLVWWLTFSILCTMYFIVLEVVLFGFLVFMVLPLIMLLYSVVLLCLGRHPLQNPHYIKPEIGKLPKSIVDRIPLVIYIPPPPDDVVSPISLPKPVHSYPPKPPSALRRKRFAFLPRRLKKSSATDSRAEDKKVVAQKNAENKEEETWEDNWEKYDYPFVRLDGNRAACAVCLMDFEEPKRLPATQDGEVKREAESDALTSSPKGEETEIPVEHITEEERDALPRLQDAGEGPQPLRLLACGHVFHKTCIDPWLIDVSGRCPVCQRPVEIDDVEPKKSKRRRRG